ncbi:hypothetical protein NDU88_004726 [Pleurodeles waltl]|uniref:Uncharacterized protein n=1 Tax=Pleurodeles waltl TaxID=8319 RepID=A0AAV7V491_PLEWA|nr:hypothetical protein NDU88_004726 [Pleurodeles waltl]
MLPGTTAAAMEARAAEIQAPQSNSTESGIPSDEGAFTAFHKAGRPPQLSEVSDHDHEYGGFNLHESTSPFPRSSQPQAKAQERSSYNSESEASQKDSPLLKKKL